MKFLVFTTLNNDNYSKRQGEDHPILRYDVKPFDSYAQARAFIEHEALHTSYRLEDFRILGELTFDEEYKEVSKMVKGS